MTRKHKAAGEPIEKNQRVMKTANDSDSITRRYNRPLDEARRLGISRRQLQNWMRDRTIPYIKRGRVILLDPAKVDEALERFVNISLERRS